YLDGTGQLPALHSFPTRRSSDLYTRAIYELLGRRHPLTRPTTREELLGQRPVRYEQRLSNAQAALGLQQLRRLEENLTHRRTIADRKSTRLNSSHDQISYAVFCL